MIRPNLGSFERTLLKKVARRISKNLPESSNTMHLNELRHEMRSEILQSQIVVVPKGIFVAAS
jgi:hypothetical protein